MRYLSSVLIPTAPVPEHILTLYRCINRSFDLLPLIKLWMEAPGGNINDQEEKLIDVLLETKTNEAWRRYVQKSITSVTYCWIHFQSVLTVKVNSAAAEPWMPKRNSHYTKEMELGDGDLESSTVEWLNRVGLTSLTEMMSVPQIRISTVRHASGKVKRGLEDEFGDGARDFDECDTSQEEIEEPWEDVQWRWD
jgi:hypothetical protein